MTWLGPKMTTIGVHFGSRSTPAPTPANNPFVRENGQVKSLSAITALIKANPQHAEALCRGAGEDPKAWMPNNPL